MQAHTTWAAALEAGGMELTTAVGIAPSPGCPVRVAPMYFEWRFALALKQCLRSPRRVAGYVGQGLLSGLTLVGCPQYDAFGAGPADNWSDNFH
eukprot:3125664-Rhodomonas_salina.1